MSKQLKMALLAGVAVVALVAAFCLRKQDETTGEANTLRSVEECIADKTFRSKSDAYEAFANEKESFYNRSAGVFERTKTVVAEAAPSVVERPRPQSAPAPSNDTPFDEAYREVERNMKGIYENSEPQVQQTTGQPSASTTPVLSAADRRREALLRDWGMNGGSAADASPVAPAMFCAVIHGTQLLKAGQVAVFRTKEPIRYGSLVVPANTLLSGVALIAENRLTVKITSVRLGQQVFALPLEVYGSDGMAGLPLDGDVVDRVAEEQTSSTAIRETGAAVSRYGGTVGRVAGALISGVGNQVRSAKNTEVKLIDNQIVILKISEQ